MANHHLRNRELSLKAKGLLSLMLSLPEDWDYTTKGLSCICKDGVDSICATIKELEKAGYVKRRRLRDAQGRLSDLEYTILEKPEPPPSPPDSPQRENPVVVKPDVVEPDVDNPELGKPHTENPAQLSIQEVNKQEKAVYSGASMVNSGYSDCTLRVTYAAKMDSNKDLVFGDKGNDNKVVLTWKRSSQNYYDTLVDDCHVFSYGIDLTKLFSDGKGDFSKVEFLIQNKTDNYFVKAELNEDEGIYYVVDHVAEKADATHFVPVKTADAQGRIIVKGMEDDTYTLTEVRTDSGYVMLKQGIDVVISRKDTADSCGIYGTDVLGLIQNDPRYASIINDSGDLHNMPQKHLEHKLLTASAAVDGKKVTMLEDNGSANAEAPLTVVNTRGFDLPKTGDNGTFVFTVVGILLMAGAASVIALVSRKKRSV